MDVKFKVRFMDYHKGEKHTLNKSLAERYIGLGVCDEVKSSAKRTSKKTKAATATENKMLTVAANK